MTHIRNILPDRLTGQGLDPNDMDPLFCDLTHALSSVSGIESVTANVKLQALGCNGMKLDYPSIQLAVAWFEFCGQNEAAIK